MTKVSILLRCSIKQSNCSRYLNYIQSCRSLVNNTEYGVHEEIDLLKAVFIMSGTKCILGISPGNCTASFLPECVLRFLFCIVF